MLIKHGDVILPDAILKNAPVLIEKGKITSVGYTAKIPEDSVVINAKGCYVSPGFIDTHIHGSPKEIFKNEIKSGTTSIVIAESCASSGKILAKIRRIEKFVKKSPLGPNVLGIRLEGPYISRVKAGAQDKHYIKKPAVKEARGLIDGCGPLLKMMTVAPEIKGARAIIKLLRSRGVKASIGHSNAAYEEALEGIAAGIDNATHIFNAISGANRPDEGAVGAILSDDEVTAEVILDLVHVPKEQFELLVKAKDADKVILVTDSVRAEYKNRKIKPGDVYRLKNGTIAGSSLTMIGALKNSVKECGISLVDAVKMLTVNPAGFFGVAGRKGKIAAGMDADIVMFDRSFDVKLTMINGNIAYRG